MRATRPPCRFSAVGCLVLICLTAVHGLSGQDLILPDLVLPASLRPDIPQPDDYPAVSGNWRPQPARSRRIYTFAASEHESEAPVFVEFGGKLTADPPVSVPSRDFPGPGRPYNPGDRWTSSAEWDLREGLILSGGAYADTADFLGAVVSMPAGIDPELPWSVGMLLERRGRFSGTTEGGLKFSRTNRPYGTASLSWEPGPDSGMVLAGDVDGLGGENGGVSLKAELGGEIRPGERTVWFGSSSEAGGWYNDRQGWGWFAAPSLWLKGRVFHPSLSIAAGVQGIFSSERRLSAVPYLDILWKHRSGWTLHGESGVETGWDSGDVLAREDVSAFNAEIPLVSRYSLGIGQYRRDVYRGELKAGFSHGTFAHIADGQVMVVESLSWSVDSRQEIRIGEGDLMIFGSYQSYLESLGDVWDALLGYKFEYARFYGRAGSGDAILGDRRPGLRGTEPIIGLGADFYGAGSWQAGLFASVRVPWESASVSLYMNWSSK